MPIRAVLRQVLKCEPVHVRVSQIVNHQALNESLTEAAKIEQRERERERYIYICMYIHISAAEQGI